MVKKWENWVFYAFVVKWVRQNLNLFVERMRENWISYISVVKVWGYIFIFFVSMVKWVKENWIFSVSMVKVWGKMLSFLSPWWNEWGRIACSSSPESLLVTSTDCWCRTTCFGFRAPVIILALLLLSSKRSHEWFYWKACHDLQKQCTKSWKVGFQK